MKGYVFILTSCLLGSLYSCTKRNDVTQLPDKKVATAVTDPNQVAKSAFNPAVFCGKYLVSGADDYNTYKIDTIVITQCGDSSVYYACVNTNLPMMGQNICCKYPGTGIDYMPSAPQNYMFSGRPGNTKVAIFFSPTHPDSISVNAFYFQCDNDALLSLTGVKIL